jgi:hypothetical protein
MTQFSRRDVLRLTGAAASIAAFGADTARRRPNIVFVLLDDLGYGQFGPNSDMFDVEQLNPIVADRDEKEITPAAALEAVKTHQSGHRKRRSAGRPVIPRPTAAKERISNSRDREVATPAVPPITTRPTCSATAKRPSRRLHHRPVHRRGHSVHPRR